MSFKLNFNPHPKRKFSEIQTFSSETPGSSKVQAVEIMPRSNTTVVAVAPMRKRKFRRLFKKRFQNKGFVNKVARRIGGFTSNGPELKFLDTDLTGTTQFPIAGANVLTYITLIPRGSSPSERVGKKCFIKTAYIRLHIQMASTTTGNGNVRVRILYDRATNKAATTAALVLTADNSYAMNLMENGKRFITLLDYDAPISVNGPSSLTLERFVRVNLPIEFTSADTTGAIGNVILGSMYVMTACGGMGTTALNAAGTIRLRFNDL